MKVISIAEPGQESKMLQEERPALRPGSDTVLITVEAFGINRADLLQRAGRYPAPAGVVQDVPGLEYAGTIAELGEHSGNWSVGDRVMGIVSGGAYAQQVLGNVHHLIPIPEGFSSHDAASIPEAYVTAWDALLLQGEMKEGDKVLIHAVGSGVGRAAVELCLAKGAIPVGTSRTPWKLERIREQYGIETVLRAGEWWKESEWAQSGQFDLILDLVGGQEVNQSLRLLVSQGALIVVGLTAGIRTELRIDVLLGKRARLMGTVLRSRSADEKAALMSQFVAEVLPMFERGELHSLCEERYSVDQIEQAHQRMGQNETFGKLVVEW